MKTIWIAAGLTVAALGLGSCETMSAQQCLAGDWGGQGYADGQAGQTMDRLSEHARACAKHDVAPDDAAYRQGREAGLRLYCTEVGGFRAGRQGEAYRGVCPAEAEAVFLPAYADGQTVHAAESALESARSSVSGYAGRLSDLDQKIDFFQSELNASGITEARRNEVRARLGELRDEKRGVERSWRQAQRDLDEAEREADAVRWRLAARYGG